MISQKEKSEERRRKSAPQWVRDAVEYWQDRVYEGDIGCDWADADIHCWRCGCARRCQRCHIIPKMLGGPDGVSNIIPLCAECHDEMPNVADPAVVWLWIASDHATTYETYWGERAFKASGLTHEEMERFSLVEYAKALDRCGLHFGQTTGRARITVQTRAWALREACK